MLHGENRVSFSDACHNEKAAMTQLPHYRWNHA